MRILFILYSALLVLASAVVVDLLCIDHLGGNTHCWSLKIVEEDATAMNENGS